VAIYVTFGVSWAFFILSCVHSRNEEHYVHDIEFVDKKKDAFKSGPLPLGLQLVNATVMVIFATIFAYDMKYSNLCLSAECDYLSSVYESEYYFDYFYFVLIPTAALSGSFILAFAIITLSVEFSYGEAQVRRLFYFLNFSAGKAAFLIFVGSIFIV